MGKKEVNTQMGACCSVKSGRKSRKLQEYPERPFMDSAKPSGIDWLGDIPVEWEVKKLRYVAKLRNENGFFSDGGIYIGLENIESSTGRYVQTETEYREDVYDIVKKAMFYFWRYCKNYDTSLKSYP